MTKNLIIIGLVIALLYLYYQKQKPNLLGSESKRTDPQLLTFLQTNLNSNSLEELKTKLGEKTLSEILEENEDWETEIDTLTRTKNSLEQDLTTQAEAFQTRQREKDREIKKLKEDLAGEKNQHKGSLGRITKLTEQITNLEKEKQELEKQLKKMPGEFPEEEDDEKKKKKTGRTSAPEVSQEKALAEFIKWVDQDEVRTEIFTGLDWNFYTSKKDWITSLKKWNALRTDRLELLEQWIASYD